MSNVETVQAIYGAFGKGDVPSILEKLDDAIEWEMAVPVPAVPWLQARRGKASVVAPVAVRRFEPHAVFDAVTCPAIFGPADS